MCADVSYPARVCTDESYPARVCADESYPACVCADESYLARVCADESYPAHVCAGGSKNLSLSIHCPKYDSAHITLLGWPICNPNIKAVFTKSHGAVVGWLMASRHEDNTQVHIISMCVNTMPDIDTVDMTSVGCL